MRVEIIEEQRLSYLVPGTKGYLSIVVCALMLLSSCFIAFRGRLRQSSVGPATFDGRNGRDLLLENFRPVPLLKVAKHELTRARFPVVDAHTHFRIKFHGSALELDEWVRLMDRNKIAVCISMDGQWGDSLDEHANLLWGKYKDRFAIFANIDWQGSGQENDPASWDCQRPDFARRVARELALAKDKGACGVKIFKSFGLTFKNPDGSHVKIDDPRWDGIWTACGELGLPVLIHVADPAAFFLPIDETNERWEELHRRPEWSFHGPGFPKREDLLEALLRVVKRHPHTTFISAHFASNAEDLSAVSQWLDEHPNLYVEIASRIAELGRQPGTARQFIVKHQDRILFGTDGPWPEQRVRLYWRFLETADEHFPYSERPFPPQGLWNIYGVQLPDEILRKIYCENAAQVIPGLRERLERYQPGN